jgi:Domain of unknown function (DUF3846)
MTAFPYDHEPRHIRAAIVAPDGHWMVEEISNDLASYQHIIGGFVTVYDPARDWRIYCHEQTGYDALTTVPLNRRATELARWADRRFGRAILGTAVIVGTGPSGQTTDLPDHVLKRLEGLTQRS